MEYLPTILSLRRDTDRVCVYNQHISRGKKVHLLNMIRSVRGILKNVLGEAYAEVDETRPFCEYVNLVLDQLDLPHSLRSLQTRLRLYNLSMTDISLLDTMQSESAMYTHLNNLYRRGTSDNHRTSVRRFLGVVMGLLVASQMVTSVRQYPSDVGTAYGADVRSTNDQAKDCDIRVNPATVHVNTYARQSVPPLVKRYDT